MRLSNIIVKLLFLSLMFTGYANAGEKTPDNINGTTKVTAEQVIELVQSKSDLVIIDARKKSDRAKGYIEGSIGLPDTETSPEALAKHIDSKDTPVLFFCNGVKCGRSVTSSKIAVNDGYTNIYWFRGGWEEWIEKDLPVTKD